MTQALTLRWPRLDEEAEFLRAHQATSAETPSFLLHYEEGMPFGRYLEVLADQHRGENLQPGYVPSTFLFAFLGERIVGRVSIRHRLNEFLERCGGHIGYVVVPEFRRRGYATAILGMALRIAGEQVGIRKVLVTCDDHNVASISTIERNGGALENVVEESGTHKRLRRYWIDTAGAGEHASDRTAPRLHPRTASR